MSFPAICASTVDLFGWSSICCASMLVGPVECNSNNILFYLFIQTYCGTFGHLTKETDLTAYTEQSTHVKNVKKTLKNRFLNNKKSTKTLSKKTLFATLFGSIILLKLMNNVMVCNCGQPKFGLTPLGL